MTTRNIQKKNRQKEMEGGIISRIFLHPEEISKHLQCTICIEVFDHPMRLNCGHTFCQKCLNELNASKVESCPECREKINKLLISEDLLAANVIGELEVLCPNGECDWKGELSQLQTHRFTKCVQQQKPQKQISNEDEEFSKFRHNLSRGLLSRNKKKIKGIDLKIPEKTHQIQLGEYTSLLGQLL